MNFHKAIGQTVREQLDFMGLTRQELADFLEVSDTSVYNLLAGNSRWTIDYLVDTAGFLDCQVEDLIDWSDIQYPSPTGHEEPQAYRLEIF